MVKQIHIKNGYNNHDLNKLIDLLKKSNVLITNDQHLVNVSCNEFYCVFRADLDFSRIECTFYKSKKSYAALTDYSNLDDVIKECNLLLIKNKLNILVNGISNSI